MKILKKNIKALMNGEISEGFLAFFLYCISLIYASIVKTRTYFYKKAFFKSKELPCKVISIGNITVGGTGKSPLTIYAARLLKKIGWRVAIISRGYGGSFEKNGGIVSNGQNILADANEAGDEAFLMALKLPGIPVLTGQNRFKSGMLAIQKFNSNLLILDDGFQHLQLKRDIDIVLLDAFRPFGNGYLLPRGTLREAITNLNRGDIFVMTRSEIAKPISNTPRSYALRPFHCRHLPESLSALKKDGSTVSYPLNYLKKQKIFIFSGIAKNEDFIKTVNSLEYQIVALLEFPDHHKYSNADLNKILKSAQSAGADFLLTTEKDWVKIANKINWDLELLALGISISFGNEESSFNNFLKNISKIKNDTFFNTNIKQSSS